VCTPIAAIFLGRTYRVWVVRPYARKPRRVPRSGVRAGTNQDFFQPPHVLDRTESFALTILRHKTTQIENGITNQLSRPMEGHVTPSVALEDLHAPLSQFRRGSKNIRRLRIAAQCNDRRVFEQEEDVTNATFLTTLDQLFLQA
jgi:hypothetical protein